MCSLTAYWSISSKDTVFPYFQYFFLKLRYSLHTVNYTDLRGTVQGVLTNAYTCVTPLSEQRTFPLPAHPPISCALSRFQPNPCPRQLCPESYHFRLALPVVEFHTNGIIEHALFIWLLLLSIMFLSFTYVAAGICRLV